MNRNEISLSMTEIIIVRILSRGMISCNFIKVQGQIDRGNHY